MEEKTKAPFWKPALIYGAIVGFVGILIGVIFYVMDLMTASWTQWLSLLISVVILVYCLSMYKKDYLGGYASYGQIWKMTMVIGVIASIIGAIYSYILMGMIDPELIDKLKMWDRIVLIFLIIDFSRIELMPSIPELWLDFNFALSFMSSSGVVGDKNKLLLREAIGCG